MMMTVVESFNSSCLSDDEELLLHLYLLYTLGWEEKDVHSPVDNGGLSDSRNKEWAGDHLLGAAVKASGNYFRHKVAVSPTMLAVRNTS